MTVTQCDGFIRISGCGPFSQYNTFENGQCFRFLPHPAGGYAGVAWGRPLRLWSEGEELCLQTSMQEFDALWRRYLDLDRDYQAVGRALSVDPILAQAVDYGQGLHILVQEPWETLCAFILSQCCNIPRIRKMLDTLCRQLGRPVALGEETFYAFPSAEALAACTPEVLAPVRAGYRAGYLLSAARRVAGGFDLEGLKALPTDDARTALTGFEGVGRKVADCVLLFGLQKRDAFPVDTWMKKAQALWPDGFPQGLFGENAGIAQQYIFHAIRSQKIGISSKK